MSHGHGHHIKKSMGKRRNVLSSLWNKRGGSVKVAKSINVEVGINVEGGIFWKKIVHKSNKRGV